MTKEKLIELLNDYEKEREKEIESCENNKIPYWEWYTDSIWLFCFEPCLTDFKWEECAGETAESMMISKSYGFVQWLIKHYYIELPMWLWRIKRKNEDWTLDYYSDEESLLMLLAISDNPIGLLLRLIDK